MPLFTEADNGEPPMSQSDPAILGEPGAGAIRAASTHHVADSQSSSGSGPRSPCP